MGKPIGYLLKCICLCNKNRLNQQFAYLDLTASQTYVMIHLFKNSINDIFPNQKKLEVDLGLSNPTVSGILQRLEAKGLIIRICDMQDKRVKCIQLTDKAKCLDVELKRLFVENEKNLVKDLSEDEIVILSKLLEKVYKQWEEEAIV